MKRYTLVFAVLAMGMATPVADYMEAVKRMVPQGSR